MARVGNVNYRHSSDDPTRGDSYWRECTSREHRDHSYSSINDPRPKANYANLSTTSSDFHGRTWGLMAQTRTVAAGKTSFHHNVTKPLGSVIKMHTASSAFERQPVRSTSMPMLNASLGFGGREQPGFGGREQPAQVFAPQHSHPGSERAFLQSAGGASLRSSRSHGSQRSSTRSCMAAYR